ncbi:hypothetical protein BC937DRAFT_88909 [Endogone sp. FLAS-F59071]|nr:hypothetical protein BC937DRAFT_88909 [Endogone sp. FLAS-F59071]|eukprot:RUS18332.1 hypothetical protein BC937DRAFT_88909 [Endogone sp. FLAS-F59071]
MFGIPFWLVVQMLFYLVVDFLIGLIPTFGDFLDFVFTANIYNCDLLEGWLEREKIVRPKAERERAQKNTRSRENGSRMAGPRAGWW